MPELVGEEKGFGSRSIREDPKRILFLVYDSALYQFTRPGAPQKEVKGTDRWCPHGDPAQKNGQFQSKTVIVTGLANSGLQPLSTGPSPI